MLLKMEKVDVVLMSAMKSGSTWLAQIIKNHNDVNLIQPKTTTYSVNNELKIDKLSKASAQGHRAARSLGVQENGRSMLGANPKFQQSPDSSLEIHY